MFIDLYEQIEELSNAIIHSEIFSEYVRCKNQLYRDEEVKKLIQSFVQLKEQFAEVERFGKYHPDYENVHKKVREKKRELDFHPKVAAFKKAERHMEQLLYEISTIIARSVSDNIKVPTGNPFFDQRSCAGRCQGNGQCICQ